MGWFFRRLTGWNVGISVLGSVVREMCGFSGRRMGGLHILRIMNKVKQLNWLSYSDILLTYCM